MKIMINGIDYTEAARFAYEEAACVLDLPGIDEVSIIVNGHKKKSELGNGGKVNGQYRIELNEQSMIDNFVDELDIAVPALVKHEAIHVHQVFKHIECGHDSYFKQCLEKLGLPNENRFSTSNEVKEQRTMKSKLNVGGIKIEELKKAASAMGKTFEEFCEMTGMKAVIETAEAEQTKVAEQEKAEQEKAEFELLKTKVETFKSAREMQVNTLKSEIEEAFEKAFNEGERGKVELKVDFTLKVNVKGAVKREGGGTRTSNGQSKWVLYVDDVEIDGVPADSEFTSSVDECMNRWNWLYYEVCKAKERDIPTFVFSRRTSLAGVAGLYKSGTKDFDWKAAARDGRLANRIGVDIGKEVRIEEVEKE